MTRLKVKRPSLGNGARIHRSCHCRSGYGQCISQPHDCAQGRHREGCRYRQVTGFRCGSYKGAGQGGRDGKSARRSCSGRERPRRRRGDERCHRSQLGVWRGAWTGRRTPIPDRRPRHSSGNQQLDDLRSSVGHVFSRGAAPDGWSHLYGSREPSGWNHTVGTNRKRLGRPNYQRFKWHRQSRSAGCLLEVGVLLIW